MGRIGGYCYGVICFSSLPPCGGEGEEAAPKSHAIALPQGGSKKRRRARAGAMPTLHRRAEQVLNLESEPGVKLRGEPLAVAIGGIALIAQQAEWPARSFPRRLGERGQRVKLVPRLWRCEMALIDAQHFLGVAAPR